MELMANEEMLERERLDIIRLEHYAHVVKTLYYRHRYIKTREITTRVRDIVGRDNKNFVWRILRAVNMIQNICQKKLRFKDQFSIMRIQPIIRGWMSRKQNSHVIFHLKAERGLRRGWWAVLCVQKAFRGFLTRNIFARIKRARALMKVLLEKS